MDAEINQKLDNMSLKEIDKIVEKRLKNNRLDGWINALVGLSKSQDKSNKTYFGTFTPLVDKELGNIFVGDAYGRKIIKAVADDMTREWISIANDEDKTIEKTLELLKAEKHYNTGICFQRCFGGSIIIIGAMDGQEFDKPLNIKNIKNIEWLKPASRSQIDLDTSKFIDNIMNPNFGKVEVYRVRLGPTQKTYNIHSSRVVEFFGEPAPEDVANIDVEIRYWGISILQYVYEHLRNFGGISPSVANIIFQFIINVFSLNGLAEKLATSNEKQVIDRHNIISMYRSLLNDILLDETESFTRDTASVAGLADLIDRMMMFLSGAAEIPVTRLFGRSPAGMNATGKADLINYYDMVKSKQKLDLFFPLQKLVDLIAIWKKLPGDHTITFNPLFQLTASEQADVKLKEAQADHLRIEDQVVDSEEVRQIRYPELDQMQEGE